LIAGDEDFAHNISTSSLGTFSSKATVISPIHLLTAMPSNEVVKIALPYEYKEFWSIMIWMGISRTKSWEKTGRKPGFYSYFSLFSREILQLIKAPGMAQLFRIQ